jgi:hypothetical protein
MVSMSQVISLTSPNPRKHPHLVLAPSMATTTMDELELNTAHAWQIHHLRSFFTSLESHRNKPHSIWSPDAR